MFEPMMDMNDKLLGIVVGIGSVGCKIIDNMTYAQENLAAIDRLYVHTSKEVLDRYLVFKDYKLLLNEHIHFSEENIKERLTGKNVVFLVAGLGGETGSLVSQYIAKIAKEMGVLCIGLFSFPFEFEGRSKKLKSQQAYLSLEKYTDALLCIENDRFLDSSLKNKSLDSIDNLFHDSNAHFNAVIQGLADLISRPGMINIDFSDAKHILTKKGLSTVGYSLQSGEDRAEVAVANLLNSPALQHYQLSKAKGVLINITAGLDMRLDEFESVGNAARAFIAENSTVVIGTSLDPDMVDTIAVTIILTGLPELDIDKNLINNEFDIVKLSKAIIFESHQASAGLAILSYFNEFLHQKCSGVEAKVSIEQNDNKVCLIIESPSGEVEKIEKSLCEFGLVVLGKIKPKEVLNSELDIARLQAKLDIAELELKQNQMFLSLYESQNEDYKSRICSLEEQMIGLQQVICNSLSQSQKHLSLQLSNYKGLPQSLLALLESNINEDISDSVAYHIENEIKRHITDSHKAISLRSLADNALYGVAGNSLYSLIISVLATLPK